jgi:translin
MDNLETIAGEIRSILDEKDTVREIALKSSRIVIRLCGDAVRAMHRCNDARQTIQDAADELHRLVGVTEPFPDLKHSGIVESAMQEYTEVRLLECIIAGKDIPSPQKLGVSPEPYLMGLGDFIGELRRLTLDHIRKGEVEKASEYMEKMEIFYDFLMRFNYPSALVDIRRTQDVARGVLEKTRGEVAVAVRTHTLERKLGEYK